MHRLTLVVALTALLACGDDSATTTTEADGSGTGSGSGSGSSGSSPATEGTADDSGGSTSDASTTSSADTSGTTTDEPTDTSGGMLEGDVLQNDSWTPMDALSFQTWPSTGDCWASVFSADASQYPFEVVGAIAAVGGGGGTETFSVAVWEVDNQGMPSTEIDSTTFDVDGSTTELTEVDLSGLGVPPFMMMNDDFALVMCHTGHMAEPSIAIDQDGTVDAARNWVYQQIMGEWVPSPEFFGTEGDFILRAVIMPM